VWFKTLSGGAFMKLGLSFQFEKASETGNYVRGWASVVELDGKPVEDTQGDIISMTELRKAAHRFITDQRVAKAMHAGSAIGEVVESVIVDDAFAKALGITGGMRGWFIGMRIHDPDIQEKVRKGVFRAFSIGGKGRRIPVEGSAS
jgi:hypothetical protein